MSTESQYYQSLNGTTSLTDVVGDRIYPVKLPQDTAYPAMFYDVEAEIEDRLSIDSVDGVYSFSNTFYASSYVDILNITEAFRDISRANQWNIAGYTDMDFVIDKNVYARTLIIIVLGKI